uniref:Uncharacterized protein n=1 Tax=Sphaeramia orbicularis TaxID=375764 RepID=A0A673AG54_9TELE
MSNKLVIHFQNWQSSASFLINDSLVVSLERPLVNEFLPPGGLSVYFHCVQIFNIRPYRYMGPVTKGEALGYLLPLQDRLSGITSHLKLQMCDGTDPSPFI